MATRCSEDSGIFQPHLNFSAPSPLGYFDNLLTPSSPSLLWHNRPSNTASSVISDLQKSNPEAFNHQMFGTARGDSTSEIVSMSDCSSLYVLRIEHFILPYTSWPESVDSVRFLWNPQESLVKLIFMQRVHWIPWNLQESTCLESCRFHGIPMESSRFYGFHGFHRI